MQHDHETEGTEHNSTEELQTDVNVPLRTDSTKVAEGGEEENFIQNSQVIEMFGVWPVLKSSPYWYYISKMCFGLNVTGEGRGELGFGFLEIFLLVFFGGGVVWLVALGWLSFWCVCGGLVLIIAGKHPCTV